MAFDWLNKPEPPNWIDLEEAEVEALKGDATLNRIVCRLVSRIRTLEHELKDPNFMYAHGRIHRQALMSRNAQIEKLQDELKKVKAEYLEFSKEAKV